MSHTITWADFEKVDLRIGTIVSCETFPQARKPAYILAVDLGELGIKKSSAQITKLYSPEELVGKQVICVCNFLEKQIGPIKSQILVTGFADENGDVVLATSDLKVKNGQKLF